MALLPDEYQKWDGSIKGDFGERYLVTARRVSNYRYIRTVIVLQDEQTADAQRFRQRWLYAGIAIVAMILISCVCWYATGKMVQPIREAHEQQNQFVSAASHDLRTPIQAIRLNAEALKLNPPDRTYFIDQILSELAHMGKLAEDLLSLTTATDHGTVEGNPVEITDLVNATVDYFRNAAVQKGIELTTSIPSQTLPLIEGNEAMLQRALSVLVDNAICYTPAGGHVDVEVSLQTRKVTIAVRDDGPGIAPEHQSRVFDRFYRVDRSRTERAHNGLGLSIAKKILTDHDGQLIYKSAKPNGSVFCMILPRLHISKQ